MVVVIVFFPLWLNSDIFHVPSIIWFTFFLTVPSEQSCGKYMKSFVKHFYVD